jgi:hypothetical protein
LHFLKPVWPYCFSIVFIHDFETLFFWICSKNYAVWFEDSSSFHCFFIVFTQFVEFAWINEWRLTYFYRTIWSNSAPCFDFVQCIVQNAFVLFDSSSMFHCFETICIPFDEIVQNWIFATYLRIICDAFVFKISSKTKIQISEPKFEFRKMETAKFQIAESQFRNLEFPVMCVARLPN